MLVVQVELKLMLNALLYNTTQAYYKCPLSNHVCTFKLFLLRRNFAVLTSPVPKEVKDSDLLTFMSTIQLLMLPEVLCPLDHNHRKF